MDLAVDGEVHEVLELGGVQAAADEAELAGSLLHALGDVALVEREWKLSVLEYVVLPGVVIASAHRVHGCSARSPARGVCTLGRTPAQSRPLKRTFHSEQRSRRSKALIASGARSGQS